MNQKLVLPNWPYSYVNLEPWALFVKVSLAVSSSNNSVSSTGPLHFFGKFTLLMPLFTWRVTSSTPSHPCTMSALFVASKKKAPSGKFASGARTSGAGRCWGSEGSAKTCCSQKTQKEDDQPWAHKQGCLQKKTATTNQKLCKGHN